MKVSIKRLMSVAMLMGLVGTASATVVEIDPKPGAEYTAQQCLDLENKMTIVRSRLAACETSQCTEFNQSYLNGLLNQWRAHCPAEPPVTIDS